MSLLLLTAIALRLGLGPSPSSDAVVPELGLQWSAPTECPDAAAVRGFVADYVEQGVPLRKLEAEASVETDGQRFSLSLRFDGQQRQLDAAACDDLARAASVILSLALVPREADEPAPPVAPPKPELAVEPPPEPVVPTPAPTPNPPVTVPRPVPPRVQGFIRPDAAIGVGITPTLTTARLAAGVAWPQARVELSGTFWAPSDAPDARADGSQTLVTMGSVNAHGCGVARAGALEFPLCAGVSVGAVRVDDPGTSPSTTTHRLWAGATASVALVWRFRPNVGLYVGPEMTLALTRPSVALQPTPSTYQTGPIAVRGAFGLEFHFPSWAEPSAGNRGR
ncbi:MAG: hypothetical protein AAF799_20455 [Myxococcota bacterium]